MIIITASEGRGWIVLQCAARGESRVFKQFYKSLLQAVCDQLLPGCRVSASTAKDARSVQPRHACSDANAGGERLRPQQANVPPPPPHTRVGGAVRALFIWAPGTAGAGAGGKSVHPLCMHAMMGAKHACVRAFGDQCGLIS